uniref:Nicastrin (inferred by orthology to a C. elegans protein) n=1 Tax=Nippostrongylus brasiliensis TaxID=27835 RepID=A0A0N4Y801_NIPBR
LGSLDEDRSLDRTHGSSHFFRRASHSRIAYGFSIIVRNCLCFSTPCGELVGVNLIAHLPPKVLNESSESEGPTKYLMLAARMDSFGLMPEVSPGEISVITSVIALLAVVQAIAKNQEAFTEAALTSNRYLLIAFFDGVSDVIIPFFHDA